MQEKTKEKAKGFFLMKRYSLVLLTICLLLLSYSPVASASNPSYFSFYAAQSEAMPSGTVRIGLSADAKQLSGSDVIAAFRVRLQYDPSRLHFVRTETSDQLQSGSLQAYSDGEQVTGVYACDGISAPKLRGECIVFVFSVAADAPPGATTIQAEVDQSANWNGEPIPQLVPQYNTGASLELSILEPPSEDTRLQQLVPSSGTLSPAFSPDIAEYTLRVGASTSSITFQATTADGAAVRINRQSLLRAGETTDITITVTAADKKTKGYYYVAVKRAQKNTYTEPEENEEELTPEPGSLAPTESAPPTASASAANSKAPNGEKEAPQSKASSTSSKAAAKASPSSSSTKKSSSKAGASEPVAPAAPAAATVPTGDTAERNLMIVGGQTDQLPLWILAGCVSVLTVLSSINYWNNRSKK